MKKIILLIDDDIDELYIFKEALKDTGENFDFIFAMDVDQGIRTVQNILPDYIFLDINMPGVNGFEALTKLRHMKIVESVPVIMYSTAIDEMVVEKATRLGAITCIRKVNSIMKLSHMLSQLFNGTYFINEKLDLWKQPGSNMY